MLLGCPRFCLIKEINLNIALSEHKIVVNTCLVPDV